MPQVLCAHCANLFLAKGLAATVPRAFCGAPDCRKAKNRERMKEFNAQNPGYYTNFPSRARYRQEVKEGLKPHHRQLRPEAARATDQRRRARKLGAECERFTSLEIYERDDWICGICQEAVDPTLSYPDPWSASLDHKVPLSRGGGHTRENTQCAHLDCNIRRQNKEL